METMQNKPTLMEGRLIYLMIVIFLIQTLYPLSVGESVIRLVGFQMLYLIMIVAGILVVRDSPRNFIVLVILGILWAISGVAFALNPNPLTILFAYATIAMYQGMVAWVLLLYIFSARVVNRDVIYATISVYLLLGAVFVGIFGIIETITFAQTGVHAFADAQVGADEMFPWQHFVFYSYATLTTLGYGDIIPTNLWARSFASLEAIIGVLFTTIVIARLVGLYSASEQAELN